MGPDRVDAKAVRKKLEGGALLVCAYDDEAKCEKILVRDAITLGQLRALAAQVPKDVELLFYCA